jgi:heme-degrading monooxygenase HmoA
VVYNRVLIITKQTNLCPNNSEQSDKQEEAMMVRIIHGPKPGTWASYKRAYKEVVAKAGKIPGLKGRWLAHADDDPDAGYTISLWENDAAMRAYITVKAPHQAEPAYFSDRRHRRELSLSPN